MTSMANASKLSTVPVKRPASLRLPLSVLRRDALQKLSGTLLGPVYFEFIQREAADGFGEGNFKALFQSLERDQIRRGALKVEA